MSKTENHTESACMNEVCTCDKMKKLMGPKNHTKLNKFITKGIIKHCPYCGKINPAWTDDYSFDDLVEAESIDPTCSKMEPVADTVNKPTHYCKGGYELGPILYVWGLSHRRASAVEYIMRAGDKDAAKEIEDLRKAIRNIEMEIEYMQKYGKVRA